MYMRGLVLGKFKPLHKGHELMIKKAIQSCDEVIIIISDVEDADIKLSLFNRWCLLYKKYANLQVVLHKDTSRPVTKDSEGTVVEEWYWDETISFLEKFNCDAIFTNDAYGKRLARELNAAWVPIDPTRKVIPISSSAIREYTKNNYHYISEEFRSFMGKRVAIVGPESTGKSTLARQLAETNKYISYVPEYGRTLCEVKNNNLTKADFKDIVDTQILMVTEAQKMSPVVITDTEHLVTELYYEEWFGEEITFNGLTYDAYFLLTPEIPWVDDGTRVMASDEARWRFYLDLKSKIPKDKLHIINSNNYNYRFQKANKILMGL
jgi:HTH-type transcriptional repressor of NAD biosynthesis genes